MSTTKRTKRTEVKITIRELYSEDELTKPFGVSTILGDKAMFDAGRWIMIFAVCGIFMAAAYVFLTPRIER
jgi:hypothetical protein